MTRPRSFLLPADSDAVRLPRDLPQEQQEEGCLDRDAQNDLRTLSCLRDGARGRHPPGVHRNSTP